MVQKRPTIIRKKRRISSEILEAKRATLRQKSTSEASAPKADDQIDQLDAEREFEGWSYDELRSQAAWFFRDNRELRQKVEVLERELEYAKYEVIRLHTAGLSALDGSSIGTGDLADEIYQLAYLSTVNGRILHSKVQASSGGKGKHAKHTEPDKAHVRNWWLKWQSDRSLFKNKTAFDEAMADKTGKKERTIQGWRKELQNEHTVI